MEEREEELILGTRNKVERNNKEETMKFLSAGALQSLQLFNAPICRHTCTPWQLYPHHLAHTHTHTHTHTHSPAHPYTHSCHSPTHAHPSSYIGTTCAHPYTYKYLQISIVVFTILIYKYHQISTHAYIYKYLQISTVTLQYLSIVQMHRLLLLT